ncbi:MAG: K(+)-transporting ATPase subunit F [Phycicoccus sp.]
MTSANAPCGRQDGVKPCQPVVIPARTGRPWWCAGGMWEDLVGGGLAVLLLTYLLYALIRPERF